MRGDENNHGIWRDAAAGWLIIFYLQGQDFSTDKKGLARTFHLEVANLD